MACLSILFLLLCIADLGLAYLLFTNLQYFSMTAMLGLFALAGIALLCISSSGIKGRMFRCASDNAPISICGHNCIRLAFSLVPAHYYGLALHALLLISIATFVSVTVIYLLGRGNIYASWANQSGYEAKFMNMSKGCLYFDYSISCYINETGMSSTVQQCWQVMHAYNMYPIASTRLDNYSWNVTFYLYKITGLANSSTANTSA